MLCEMGVELGFVHRAWIWSFWIGLKRVRNVQKLEHESAPVPERKLQRELDWELGLDQQRERQRE